MQLQQVRQAITDAERREAEQRRGAETRPPEPDWLIERGIGDGHALYVHVGGCHMKGKRSRGATQDQARRALAEGVAACSHCRPDTELGVLG